VLKVLQPKGLFASKTSAKEVLTLEVCNEEIYGYRSMSYACMSCSVGHKDE
jgi:hypothetical protein